MTNNKDQILQDKTKVTQAKSQIASTLLGKIQQHKANAKHTLLIDVSGSMNEYVSNEAGNEAVTKIAIVEDLLTKIPVGTTRYAFSTKTTEFYGNDIPHDFSSTNMTGAFREMKDNRRMEIVLITDGMPDDPVGALKESKGMKIDIIYIGPQPRPEFLEKLARATSGSFTNINLIQKSAIGELENKVQLLLGA